MVGEIEALLVQVGRDEGTRAVVRRAAQISHRYAPDLLEEQERRAREHRFLALTSNHDGTMRVKGFFDAEAAALLTAVFGSLAAPAPAELPAEDELDEQARLHAATPKQYANDSTRRGLIRAPSQSNRLHRNHRPSRRWGCSDPSPRCRCPHQ